MKAFHRIEHIKRISAVFLSLMLVITAVFPVLSDTSDLPWASVSSVYAASDETNESSKAVTEITGYPAVINKTYKKTVKFSATVSPAKGGRKV